MGDDQLTAQRQALRANLRRFDGAWEGAKTARQRFVGLIVPELNRSFITMENAEGLSRFIDHRAFFRLQ